MYPGSHISILSSDSVHERTRRATHESRQLTDK